MFLSASLFFSLSLSRPVLVLRRLLVWSLCIIFGGRRRAQCRCVLAALYARRVHAVSARRVHGADERAHGGVRQRPEVCVCISTRRVCDLHLVPFASLFTRCPITCDRAHSPNAAITHLPPVFLCSPASSLSFSINLPFFSLADTCTWRRANRRSTRTRCASCSRRSATTPSSRSPLISCVSGGLLILATYWPGYDVFYARKDRMRFKNTFPCGVLFTFSRMSIL